MSAVRCPGVYEPFSNTCHSDVLHPNRPNVSKDELRSKLSELYKANKDAVSVFGFRTQYGGGKSTGFALVYDSPEALKKFEPNYRLVRYSLGKKVEKASRQQRTSFGNTWHWLRCSRTRTNVYGQASNARTDPRSSEEQPRQRAARRRPRSKCWFVDDDGGAFGRVVGQVADDMVYIYTVVARQWLHFNGKDAGVWLTRFCMVKIKRIDINILSSDVGHACFLVCRPRLQQPLWTSTHKSNNVQANFTCVPVVT